MNGRRLNMLNQRGKNGSIIEPFFISAIPNDEAGGSRLFRPKNFTELMFPEIGMILYHFYWNKYLLYFIIEHNMTVEDIKAQEFLFFYSKRKESDGEMHFYPDEGILYCSLIGVLNSTDSTFAAGTDWARYDPRKFFENHWEVNIIEQLKKFSRSPTFTSLKDIIPKIFQQDFIQKLKSDHNVSLEHELWKEFSRFEHNPEKNIAIKNLLLALSEALTSLVRCYPDWFKRRKLTGLVIQQNLDYIEKILLPLKDKDNGSLTKLANLSPDIILDEAIAFLQLHEKGKRQQRFLVSFMLMCLISSQIGRQLNYKEVELWIRTASKETLVNIQISSIVSRFNFLEKKSYSKDVMECAISFWKFNFFLSDGEAIARVILNEKRDSFTNDNVKEILRMKYQDKWSNFVKSVDDLSNDDFGKHLVKIIEIVKGEKQERTSTLNALEIIIKGLQDHEEPLEIVCRVLEFYEIIRRRNAKVWDVQKNVPINNNAPFFYGITAFLQWYNILLKVIEHG